jgi:ABC-type branched-subunit amino acid transport system substrate-binding protein
MEKVGFEFPFRQPVQVVESNYTPYVLQMKQQGIKYVTMVSDYQSIVRLTKAMRQQGWYPDVMDWDSVVYSPKFLQQAEGSAENSLFFTNTALFEEASSNPEMQLYVQWLQRVAPGAQPDYFGLYSWSAGRLFAKVAEAVGPKLTRKAFLAELQKVHAWGGNGLHAEHDVGGKRASGCLMYGQVKGAKFVRLEPSGKGWFCDRGALVKNPL